MVGIRVVCTGRNHSRYLRRCLESVAAQDHEDVKVHVSDDASDEAEREVIQATLAEMAAEHGWTWVIRKERVGALRNQIEGAAAICDSPSDVVVFLDGDDRLASPEALSTVSRVYDKGGELVLLTYGSYSPDPPSGTCAPAMPYPADVTRRNSFRRFTRESGPRYNHLRTVRWALLSQLGDDDLLLPDGSWIDPLCDMAIMIPCLEMAQGRYRVIRDTLLLYTSDNPQSDWRVQAPRVDAMGQYILSKPPRGRWEGSL